jgi:hypothetical protein
VESLRKLVQQSGLVERSLEGLFLKPLSTAQLSSLDLGENVYEAMLKVGKDFPELSVGLLMEVQTP